MSQFTLIQPRSPWGLQPYLPNGLLSVAARLASADIDWRIIDENLDHRLELERDGVIGIGCLGPPYVSEVLRVGQMVRRQNFRQPILIGGEFVKRLTHDEFTRIFYSLSPVAQAGEEEELDRLIGHKLPSAFDLSIGDVLRKLPTAMLKAYFEKEWCLFTSQGCTFNCDFCAADKHRKERFRNPDTLANELAVIAPLIRRFAGPTPAYEVYCSTLDGFQTPAKMEETLENVYDAMRHAGVKVKIRFLATAQCTVAAERRHPGIIKRFANLGVTSVGVGVDGDDAETWADQNKKHNNAEVIKEALDLLLAGGIQPETFMVIGFPGSKSSSILKGGLASFRYARQGMRVRPYLGKTGMPGTKGWEEGGVLREQLLQDPKLFRELDYGGLGSPATHPDPLGRRLSNAVFMATCLALKATKMGCPTQPLLPTESVSPTRKVIGHVWNRLMPQDR